MGVFLQLCGEFLMIACGLGFFLYFTGIKVSCPHCGERFYYQKGRQTCPVCQCDLESSADAKALPDGPESYLCYGCGLEVETKVDNCPRCGCWIGQNDDEELPLDDNSKKQP